MSFGTTSASKATIPRSPIAPSGDRAPGRWFFSAMAVLMIATSIGGFAPAILNPAGRRAPLSLLGAAHGIVFFAWLVIFLVQVLLVESRRLAWHRRLGLASAFVLILLVPLGFAATIAMVRRGFDLSGDQQVGQQLDAATASVFNLGDLLTFTLLVAGALWFRRRPVAHKRLMLFANIHLMGAPITHLLGHNGLLTPASVIGVFMLFVLAAIAGDYLVDKRAHPLTAGLAILSVALLPIEGALVGPSSAWHHFVVWLARTA
jgi:hypothetical protein